MFEYIRFRYRRQTRRAKRNLRTLRSWGGNYLDRHIWGKSHQLGVVRRFLLVWWGVVVLLVLGLVHQIGGLETIGRVAVPVQGGTYSEAAVGTVKNLNPVLPESEVSDDLNRLIFSGLTQYNQNRQLVGDLATGWKISPDGHTYTFHLRHGVKWQDGVPFTSTDVAFTIAAIQDPDSRSPLASSWQGVKVDTPDDFTVVFTLPSPLASFLDSTTLGIVPRHLLESVEPSLLREAGFNQHPIGTGPFKLKTFAPSANEVDLVANPNYYGGRPELDGFSMHLYDTDGDALAAYAKHQVLSPGRIRPDTVGASHQLPGLDEHDMTLPEESTLFFNMADSVFGDKPLRDVLSRSVDRAAIIDHATAGQAVAVTQPILPGEDGYTTKYAPAPLSPAAARQVLEADGWVLPTGESIRAKDGHKLTLQLVTLADTEQTAAANELKRQYAALGIAVTVKTADINELEQTYMRPRNFQMLLFGVNLGADPDVYSFWHSSQAKDPGVNLSGYSSPEADAALEAGRVKTDPLIRAGKYNAFLQAWDGDEPAVVLYQTGYQYAADAAAGGITARRLVTPSDRFYGVQNWTIKQRLESR